MTIGFISARIMSLCEYIILRQYDFMLLQTVCIVCMFCGLCIYIIYIIYMRDLVTFDTGLVQVNLLLSQMRHIPSQQFKSRAFSTFYDFHICIVPIPCSSHCHVKSRSYPRASDILFVDNQFESIRYYWQMIHDYSSESVTLTKGNPEQLDEFFCFVPGSQYKRQLYMVMLVSRYLIC